MRLETAALHWLMYVRKCHYALRERSPRERHTGEPDALGVTTGRLLIVIEIKRTMSDFRADAKKPAIRNRDLYMDKFPYEFYYLTPIELTERVELEVPEWAGLLSAGGDYVGHITVEKKAPKNRESEPLSIKECVKFCRCLSNHILAAEKARDRITSQWLEGRYEWGSEYSI